jgi:hypothetical protein
MNAGRAGFGFTSLITASRLSSLLAWREFEEIASRIASSCIISYEWEAFCTSLLLGCNRASFAMRIDSHVYDAFFNSPVGVRAMFAVSPSSGESANRLLVDQITPRLIAFRDPNVPLHPWTAKSLSLHEAKVWIVESEVEDQLSDEQPSLVYAPWECESVSGEGLRAPVGTSLEVKGGWIDSNRVERRNPAKAHRSLALHKTGYV